MASFVQEYSGGLTISVVGHAVLLLMFGFNLITMSFKEAPPVQLAIEATVVDMGAVRKKQEEEKRRQLELDRQKQAAEAERRKKVEAKEREQEQQRVAEQKRKQEVEQKRIAEQKRKAETEKKKVAEQKRKAEAEAEKKKVAEQKRKAEAARVAAEKKREAAERRREEERQRQFQSEIEAEEQRLAAISSGKMQQYLSAIGARVARNWVRPASAKPGIECIVRVTQIPGGEVVNVRVESCNGDAAVVRSVEAAVYKASPLPPPPDPTLFDRNLRFAFKPEE